MTAHKFLSHGAIGPLSGFTWPVPAGGEPGAWVEAVGPLVLCARGVHVCRAFELAHWVHDELWEVETDGEQLDGVDCIVVQRARLTRRIDSWNATGRRRFGDACIEHAAVQAGPESSDEVRALLDDARFMSEGGDAALTAFTAAVAVSRSSADAVLESAYRRERAWQSAWLADQLLTPRPA
jgi:hypothetical protein